MESGNGGRLVRPHHTSCNVGSGLKHERTLSRGNILIFRPSRAGLSTQTLECSAFESRIRNAQRLARRTGSTHGRAQLLGLTRLLFARRRRST